MREEKNTRGTQLSPYDRKQPKQTPTNPGDETRAKHDAEDEGTLEDRKARQREKQGNTEGPKHTNK